MFLYTLKYIKPPPKYKNIILVGVYDVSNQTIKTANIFA